MHSALLVPLKIFMFFIICLLTLSFLTCVKICISASVMLAEGAGDVPLKGVWIVVLVLGWTLSKKFSNSGLLFVVLICCGFVPVVAVPGSGGGVAVGWYPVRMWLPVGLGVLLWYFLQALMSWFGLLQCVQKTLSLLHSILMWPCSPHLKHVGPFLLSKEFGELL